MSEQMLHSPVSPADVERHQKSDPIHRDTVLEKLYEDSRMSAGQKALTMGSVVASESLTRGPLSAAITMAAPVFGLPLSGLAVTNTTFDVQRAVRAEELKKESALIKEHFGPQFPSGGIAKIETDCSHSKTRKAAVYALGTVSEAAIGFGSGVVLSPATAGYSIPVLTVGGAGTGYLNAGRLLEYYKYGCEVDKMKSQIRSW